MHRGVNTEKREKSEKLNFVLCFSLDKLFYLFFYFFPEFVKSILASPSYVRCEQYSGVLSQLHERVILSWGFLFEYIGGKKRHGAEPYFHCKCKDCGKLIHVRCSKLSAMQSHLLSSHGFKIDSHRTVLYGTCGECSGRKRTRGR